MTFPGPAPRSEQFPTYWKDADPDLPVYQQAKAEYAASKTRTTR
jgi:hypothetical protein